MRQSTKTYNVMSRLHYSGFSVYPSNKHVVLPVPEQLGDFAYGGMICVKFLTVLGIDKPLLRQQRHRPVQGHVAELLKTGPPQQAFHFFGRGGVKDAMCSRTHEARDFFICRAGGERIAEGYGTYLFV